MTNTRASQRKEEEAKKLKEQNEGAIASRLRSRLKIGDADTHNTDKKSQPVTEMKPTRVLSRNEKDKSKKNSVEKKSEVIQSSKLDLKESSKDVGKKKEKATPPQPPISRGLIYYIKYKGFEETRLGWNCALCEKNLTGDEEEAKQENEQLYSLYSHHHVEEEMVSLLPEVDVLSCNHVFHTTCLSALQLPNITDPPCPICLSILSI